MDDVMMIKVIFIFAMFISAGIFGFLPILSPSFHKNEYYLSLGNCFAAGIFIIVGLAGLLPDAQKSFEEDMSSTMPLAFVLAACGYMTIFFIENVLFSHTHEVSEEFHHHNPSHNASHSEGLSINYLYQDEGATKFKKIKNKNDLIPAIILTSALVVHSIFEGIAVGLLQSESSTITLCVAVLIHNIPAAIALGIKLQNLTRWIYCTLMAIFVFASPFSIMIGIFLSDAGYPGVEGTFLSISAGTFIYIGCSEILPEEMEKDFSKLTKFAAFSLGCLPLAIFFLLAPED